YKMLPARISRYTGRWDQRRKSPHAISCGEPARRIDRLTEKRGGRVRPPYQETSGVFEINWTYSRKVIYAALRLRGAWFMNVSLPILMPCASSLVKKRGRRPEERRDPCTAVLAAPGISLNA